jgi:crotonobetainyl-CoA:carnitine CoA-transferase CaiB-like acyl-CoA transferase
VDDGVNRQRGGVATFEWGERGRVDQPSFPPQFGPDPVLPVRAGIPALGEHTAEVLREVGATEEEIAAYVEAGAIGGS